MHFISQRLIFPDKLSHSTDKNPTTIPYLCHFVRSSFFCWADMRLVHDLTLKEQTTGGHYEN